LFGDDTTGNMKYFRTGIYYNVITFSIFIKNINISQKFFIFWSYF